MALPARDAARGTGEGLSRDVRRFLPPRTVIVPDCRKQNPPPNMALQRTRRPRIRSGRSLRSLGSPLNARPFGAYAHQGGARKMKRNPIVRREPLLLLAWILSSATARGDGLVVPGIGTIDSWDTEFELSNPYPYRLSFQI